jgi:hypothetical protein
MSSPSAFFFQTIWQPFAAPCRYTAPSQHKLSSTKTSKRCNNSSPGQSVIPAGRHGRVAEHTHGTLIEPPHARHEQKHCHCESAESACCVGLDRGQDLPRQRRVLLDREGDVHQHGALDLPRNRRRSAHAGAAAAAEEAEEAGED